MLYSLIARNGQLAISYIAVLTATFLVSCDQKKKTETVEAPIEYYVNSSAQNVDSILHKAYDREDLCLNTEFETIAFDIKDLPLSERPYKNTKTEVTLTELRDENNVVMLDFRGTIVYHPHLIAKTGIGLLDIFRRTGDSSALHLAEAHAKKLIDMGIEKDESLLIPYGYDYKFHERDWLMAPWVSGIAQGKALSLISRLYEVTSNPVYLDAAHKIFHSFSRLKATHKDWISSIDKNGNLWFEEYPAEHPTHVFNGMIYATIGVYDYHLISKSDVAARYLRGAVSTLNNTMEHLRDPGALSYYCLKYSVKNPDYHPKHVWLLKSIYDFSELEAFSAMADSIKADTPPK